MRPWQAGVPGFVPLQPQGGAQHTYLHCIAMPPASEGHVVSDTDGEKEDEEWQTKRLH